jgi:ribosomal protein S18 acetylase RimI-like enzyme
VKVVEQPDRDRLAAFLARDPAIHAYALGDLDDFFWPHTRWFGLENAGLLLQVALLYAEHDPPTLIALSGPPAASEAQLVDLLERVADRLPSRFECHARRSVTRAIQQRFDAVRGPTPHLRMALVDDEEMRMHAVEVTALGPADLQEAMELYAAAYPTSWFDARRLETGRYVGLRREGRLVTVAGVHVHAPALGVAALGDVATLPSHRGHGLAAAASAGLCVLLRDDGCTTIALNVREDNTSARAAYERIGFRVVMRYFESKFERPAPVCA